MQDSLTFMYFYYCMMIRYGYCTVQARRGLYISYNRHGILGEYLVPENQLIPREGRDLEVAWSCCLVVLVMVHRDLGSYEE